MNLVQILMSPLNFSKKIKSYYKKKKKKKKKNDNFLLPRILKDSLLSFNQSIKKKSRKAIPPSSKPLLLADLSPEAIFSKIEELVKTCQGKSVRQTHENLLSLQSMNWVEHEYFYSYFDKAYYNENEFKKILQYFQIPLGQKFSKSEWRFIRMILGKTRRFSQAFLKKEKQKLDIYRKIVRSYLNDNSYPIEKYINSQTLLEEVKSLIPFAVGQICQAIHPVCKHFHHGTVLTTNNSQVILKFFTNELGVHKINQNQLTIELSESKQLKFSQPISYFTEQKSDLKLGNNHQYYQEKQEGIYQNNNNFVNFLAETDFHGNCSDNITDDLDFFAMAFLIKILERKNALINELRNFNNKAEKNSNDIDEIYCQEYGWAGVHISLLDNALKHICAKFRLRGVNNENLSQIQNNFDKILLHPLKQFISKDRQNQFELDKNVLKELTQIIDKTDEEQIMQKVNQFFTNSLQQLKIEKNNDEIINEENKEQNQQGKNINPVDFDIDEQKILQLNQLIQNCIGFLANVLETKEINLSNNQFVRNLLCNPVFENNPEKFHEINNIILNLNRQKVDWLQQNS